MTNHKQQVHVGLIVTNLQELSVVYTGNPFLMLN